MQKVATAVALCSVAALTLVGAVYWNRSDAILSAESMSTGHSESYRAQQLLHKGLPSKALKIIYQHREQIDSHTPMGRQWLALFINCCQTLHDYSQLAVLHDHFPNAFHRDEEASLGAAHGYILSGDKSGFDSLRKMWQQREGLAARWLAFDVDRLLMDGNHAAAVELLASRSFDGSEDVPRLLKLAILHSSQPEVSWKYLTAAVEKDPADPEVYSYRARFLEAAGHHGEALTECRTALLVAPEDPYYIDQLAEFLVNQKQYAEAIALWKESLQIAPREQALIKILFWARVVAPESQFTPDHYGSFASYLSNMKAGYFWDSNAFAQLPDREQIAASQPAVFWLRLLDALANRREEEAVALLNNQPQDIDLGHESLRKALQRALLFREKGSSGQKSALAALKPSQPPLVDSPELLIALLNNSENSLPEELHPLLASQECFSALFLAAGWREAALQLHAVEPLSREFPDWVALNLTESLKVGRGNVAALSFAAMQPWTPQIAHKVAELLAAVKHSDIALNELKAMSGQRSGKGDSAAWLLALVYIERGHYQAAKAVVEGQPSLRATPRGQEVIARIAALEGDIARAELLYSAIADDSVEAKSFLARKAFTEENWDQARLLTQSLLQIYPDSSLLQENLRKIDLKSVTN
jgi:tetratricopeptide (TPR) repeat protein